MTIMRSELKMLRSRGRTWKKDISINRYFLVPIHKNVYVHGIGIIIVDDDFVVQVEKKTCSESFFLFEQHRAYQISLSSHEWRSLYVCECVCEKKKQFDPHFLAQTPPPAHIIDIMTVYRRKSCRVDKTCGMYNKHTCVTVCVRKSPWKTSFSFLFYVNFVCMWHNSKSRIYDEYFSSTNSNNVYVPE